MLMINGREVGLMYTIGVHLDYSDFLIKNENISTAEAIIEKAVLMNAAYLAANGIQNISPLTREELRALKFYQFKEILDAVKEAENRDTQIQIHTKEPEESRKNAGSAASL